MNSTNLTCRTSSPLGEILLVANPQGDALTGLYLERQKYFPENAARWTESPRLPLFRKTIVQLHEYFAGTRIRFELPLAPDGTAFQRAVWSALACVLFVSTLLRGDLPFCCVRPLAFRSAGASTGRNPLTVVVPCHRIMGSGGALTGYAGGLDRKRALLELESRHAPGVTRKVA